MTTIFDLILEELEYRKVMYHERFGSYYAISIGCHLFNLANKGEHEYPPIGDPPPPIPPTDALMKSSEVEDTRLHIMFVTPPGFGKTYFIEMYMKGFNCIIPRIGLEHGIIPCKIVITVTGAGFVGTVRPGKTVTDDFGNEVPTALVTQGVAQRFSTGFIGVDEFSDLTKMMKRGHSSELDTALLVALDSGDMEKDLAPGNIAYHTSCTLWGGTQPERFDLSSGLARRFIFMRFTPTREDMDKIRHTSRLAYGMNYRPDKLRVIRDEIKRIKRGVRRIKKVEYDWSVYDFIDDFCEKRKLYVPHFEELPLRRLMLGYWIMNGRNQDEHLMINLDERLKRIIGQEILWRKSIKKGGEFGEIEMVLVEHYMNFIKGGGKSMSYRGIPIRDLQDKLQDYGLDLGQSRKRILSFEHTGEIYFAKKAKKISRVILTRTDDPKPDFGDILGWR